MLGGIVAGLIYSNAQEWLVHKYVLHGLGRKKDSFFAFHWHEHHKRARKADMRDEDYERDPWGTHAQGKNACYGHSMVINPWGHVTAQVSDGVGATSARLDFDYTAKVRAANARMAYSSKRLKLAILRVSGVASASALAMSSEMRPISVCSPVAVTTPVAVP